MGTSKTLPLLSRNTYPSTPRTKRSPLSLPSPSSGSGVSTELVVGIAIEELHHWRGGDGGEGGELVEGGVEAEEACGETRAGVLEGGGGAGEDAGREEVAGGDVLASGGEVVGVGGGGDAAGACGGNVALVGGAGGDVGAIATEVACTFVCNGELDK
ncbi:Uncharacterized protein Fot_12836 [Forsythia ovata]|uniref:Uncharacterized protein n=1 Tax=Forsythia ovata TaxID=205694 RepID=A0ABD1W4B3_9LAMI